MPPATRSPGFPHDDEDSVEEVRIPEPVQDRDESSHALTTSHLEDAKSSPAHRTTYASTRWKGEVPILAHLALFSILGTLARLGLQWLTFYPGAPTTMPVLWANVAGSLIFGFLSEDKRLFRSTHPDPSSSSASKKTVPLYIGLATGFCGSLTSFSTFMRDAFLALANGLPAPLYHPATSPSGPNFSAVASRSAGDSVLSTLAVLIMEPALSLAALTVGAHLALLLEPVLKSLPHRAARRLVDPLAVFLGFGAWLGVIFVAAFPRDDVWRGEALFALVFAPLGAGMRYYVSLWLNGRIEGFPLGTFAVNMAGTAVLGMCFNLQRVRIGGMVGGSLVGCQVLQGVEDGFCGCLTTVSTWVGELKGLRRRHAYIYGATSMGVGLALLVVIMGSVRWSIGWSAPICVTMRTVS